MLGLFFCHVSVIPLVGKLLALPQLYMLKTCDLCPETDTGGGVVSLAAQQGAISGHENQVPMETNHGQGHWF